MFKPRRRARAGVALSKALVALAFVATALGVLLVAVYAIRDPKFRGGSTGQWRDFRYLATAIHLAHDQHKTIPPCFGAYGGKSSGTFHYHLLPFLDNVTLWNNPDGNAVVPYFIAPKDPTLTNGGAGAASLAVNLRLFYTKGGLGEFQPGTRLKLGEIADGTGNTLLLATKYHVCGAGGSLWLDLGNNAFSSPTAATFGGSMELWQCAPTQVACNPMAGTAVSFSEKHLQIVLADTSFRTVVTGMSLPTWQAAHTFAAQDVLGPDWPE